MRQNARWLAATLAALPAVFGLSFTAQAAEVNPLQKINHIVVIYQENHSFDNLFGGWEGVDGLAHGQVAQVDQRGHILPCLPQVDVNLASPQPLPITCTSPDGKNGSHFANAPFPIEKFIAATDTTCPKAGQRAPLGVAKGKGEPGGCTMDLDHRFYQERYQLHAGRLDRYAAGSNAAGMVMGHYDTKNLTLYRYLHRQGPNYVIADNFFQGAFGGSFLNHQWLIAARTPEWPGAVNDGSGYDQHAVVDANGMPKNTPLYSSATPDKLKDAALTASCAPAPGRGPTPPGETCGDYAVNTIQPKSWPYDPAAADAAKRLPMLTYPTIGERLSARGVDWAWYSGGWADADGDRNQPGFTNGSGPSCGPNALAGSLWPKCPDKLFQFHHQPFNYFAAYAPGTEARQRHLRDEAEFVQLAKSSGPNSCNLKPVSFVKPLGADNEHPGYASEYTGNGHLVDLIEAVENSGCAGDTMIIVTYDEFGGQADHVAPPGPGNRFAPHDQWGPGTRIPALILAPHLPHRYAVDHESHDTTSILATIEHRFGLTPLTGRDSAVRDLSSAFTASPVATTAR
jgi:phospholipase C